MTVLKDFQSHARKSGTPATYGLIAGLIIAFLLSWITQNRSMMYLAFDPGLVGSRPWSVFTYPFAYSGLNLIGVLLTCLWLFWIATYVERELGTPRYLALFGALTIIPLLLLSLGFGMLKESFVLDGMYLPLAGVTVAWATRNPTATVLLAMIIPVQARIIGWLTVALIFFGFGFRAPLLGVFAVAHLALAWAYAANKLAFLPWGRVSVSRDAARQMKWEKERDEQYFDDVKRREKEREERERLRRLFESSVKDDEDK